MSLSRADFLVAYPEFVTMPTTQVDAQLALAEAQVDREVWDANSEQEQGDLGVGLYAAAALRRNLGEHAAGPAEDFTAAFEERKRAVAAAFRMI